MPSPSAPRRWRCRPRSHGRGRPCVQACRLQWAALCPTDRAGVHGPAAEFGLVGVRSGRRHPGARTPFRSRGSHRCSARRHGRVRACRANLLIPPGGRGRLAPPVMHHLLRMAEAVEMQAALSEASVERNSLRHRPQLSPGAHDVAWMPQMYLAPTRHRRGPAHLIAAKADQH